MSRACIGVMAVVVLMTAVAVPAPAFAEREPGAVEATCTADCGASPLVEVRCPGSCVSYDRSCPGQRGYVQCAGGPKIYCEDPCTCSAETFCPEGGSVFCTGTGEECYGGNGFCYVECNGQVEYCPGHEGEEWCETSAPW